MLCKYFLNGSSMSTVTSVMYEVFILFFFNFRERSRRREREKHQRVASCMHPNQWLNSQPQCGIKSTTSWCAGQHSGQLSHPARVKGFSFFFKKMLLLHSLFSFLKLQQLTMLLFSLYEWGFFHILNEKPKIFIAG